MKISEYQTNCHAEAVRLASAKTAIATAIEGKGVTVPDGTLLDGIAPLIESIETGGGGVQPDWNQNDSTQPDYIKNRPFYTGNPVETVLVEESTVSFADHGGIYVAQFPSTFAATVGEAYKVYWDGTAYECVCVDFNNNLVIGNLSVMGAGSDTGEPFLMAINNDSVSEFYTADTSASHTISISATVVSVVKIDEKYLPNTVATKSEVEVAQTTANNAKSEALDLAARMFGHTSVVDKAFYNDKTLSITSLPACIESIGDYAFTRCYKLALTSLPSGLTSIGDYAFQGCTGLTSITFTGKPTTIISSAFAGCTNLTTINVPWAEGEVANAPWGATNATINYNYTEA